LDRQQRHNKALQPDAQIKWLAIFRILAYN
jgi:hypothetical protein